MKNKIGAFSLGLAFAGSFLGAGYVSGQELWQFFGVFGKNGTFGLVLAISLLLAVGLMMLDLNRKTEYEDVDRLVIMWDLRVLRGAVFALEVVFLFGVCMIMTAGIGALLHQLLDLPAWVGSAVFTVMIAVLSLYGFSGMVKAFSATVPVLAFVTLIFGIMSVSQNGISLSSAPVSDGNPLMGSWPVAALSFACYNIFGSIAMIAPLGRHTKKKSTVLWGVLMGSMILLIIAGSVLICVSAEPQITSEELPMLALAYEKSKALGYLYGILLLLAMFGTSLSSLVGFGNMVFCKSEKIKKNRVLFTALTALAFFGGSMFGFGELIGIIYPLFGYASSVFIVLMAIHWIRVRKNVRTEYKA